MSYLFAYQIRGSYLTICLWGGNSYRSNLYTVVWIWHFRITISTKLMSKMPCSYTAIRSMSIWIYFAAWFWLSWNRCSPYNIRLERSATLQTSKKNYDAEYLIINDLASSTYFWVVETVKSFGLRSGKTSSNCSEGPSYPSSMCGARAT